MPSYSYKDRVKLTHEANKKRLRCEGQIMLAEVLNEAINEMDTQFNDALAEGRLLEIGGSADDMKRFLRMATDRHLGQLPSGS